MANEQNLVPFDQLTESEQREIRSKGGKASAEAKKKKRDLRKTMKSIMEMEVYGDKNKENLSKFGIPEDEHDNYSAVAVRLLQRALAEGDNASIRTIADLTGDGMKSFFGGPAMEDDDLNRVQYPTICLPDNGRDRKQLNVLRPQAGPQTMFMCSEADIIIYGGAAGGGKTYALLMEGLRHKDVPGFGAVIFRHNFNQITSQGGLWDASHKIYDQVPDAVARKTPKLHWDFASGARLSFAHIERDDDLQSWQGTEIAYIGFDELTHFTRHMFLYMLSRNRTTCGVKPYVRATCNPDSDSWVAEFISWWIDPDTGYPIPERSGRIRYMVTLNDIIYMADTKEELMEKHGVADWECKSVTFIASKLEDNKILMESDPGYMANLKALTEVDKERLLYGNWKIKAAAGRFFKRVQIGPDNMLPIVPADVVWFVRAWDYAATDETEGGDPDFTSGTLIGKRRNGRYVVIDVINQQIKAGEVENLILQTAIADRAKYGYNYTIRLAQDPGAAGKIVAQQYIQKLAGFSVSAKSISGSKEVRATPFATQWQNGFVDIVIGPWNEMYFNQLESFPESNHDDMVDSSADAFAELTEMNFDISNLL